MLFHHNTGRYDPFEEGKFFYIFNKGNNNERIFFHDENYKYFLRRFDEYMSPFLTVYAYCLLPNLFHFLVRIKEGLLIPGERKPVSQAFSNFFNAYTKVINKEQGRCGSIFEKQFKHIRVEDCPDNLINLVYYIHRNPLYHGLSRKLGEYPWCSYSHILADVQTKLSRDEVITWLGGKTAFVNFHQSDSRRIENSKDYLLA